MPATYLGYPLLDVMPHRQFDAPELTSHFAEMIESKAGAFNLQFATDRHPWSRTFHWMCMDRAQILEAEIFCDALRGSYNRFWVPTWASDLTLVQGAAQGTDELIVEDTVPAPLRDDLMVLTPASREAHKIESYVSNGNGTATVTLVVPLANDLVVGRTLLSYLCFAHLQSDSIDYSFVAMNAMEILLPWTELLPMPVGALDPALFDPASIPDFLIWYKANALFGEGYGGGGETPTEWVDSSGNGYHAVPFYNPPLTTEPVRFFENWPLGEGLYDINGMPLMLFQANGEGQGAQMVSPFYPMSLGRTFFVMARIEGSPSASKAFASVGGDINTTFSQFTEVFGVAKGNWGWNFPNVELGGSIFFWCIAAVTLTPFSGQCYINGVPSGGSFTPAAGLSENIDGVQYLKSARIVLGGYDAGVGGNHASCVIAESLMYQRVLTTTEIDTIVAYLTAKYDL